MRVCALVSSALLLTASPLAAADSKQSGVVSTALCADTYVLEQVRHDDVKALSWQSADAVSAAPSSLQGLPKAWNETERLLMLNPKLVVFGPGEGVQTQPFLKARGIAHVTLQWGEDIKTVSANRALLANALGAPAPTSASKAYPATNKTVLYISRAGGTAGPGTYVDTAIKLAGGVNIIETNGWHTPDPETLINLKPDLIVTSFFKQGYASVNQRGLQHRIIQQKLNATKRVDVPGHLWPCAGPGLQEATALIAEGLHGEPQ